MQLSALLQVEQAIKLLDKNNDSLIQFGEFVDWWQNEVGASHFLLSLLHEWQRSGDRIRYLHGQADLTRRTTKQNELLSTYTGSPASCL